MKIITIGNRLDVWIQRVVKYASINRKRKKLKSFFNIKTWIKGNCMPSRNEAITVDEVKCQDITEVL